MLKHKTRLESTDPFALYLQEISHLKEQRLKKGKALKPSTNPQKPSQSPEHHKKESFEKHLRLVILIAKRYQHRGLPLLDLIQEGNIGLMQAIDRFDQARGLRFSTYAVFYIRGAIQTALKSQGALIRLPEHRIRTLKKIEKARKNIEKTEEPSLLKLSQALDMVPAELHDQLNHPYASESVEALSDGDQCLKELNIPSPLQAVLAQERYTLLAKALKRLNERQRKMIFMRFGMSKEKEHTLQAIGTVFKLSRERVRQIEEQALGIMKKSLSSAGYVP